MKYWRPSVGRRGDSDQQLLRRRLAPRALPTFNPLRVADLFAGCGGMTLGLALAAHKLGRAVAVPLAVDIDRDAVAVFSDNFPSASVRCTSVDTLFDGRLGASLTTQEKSVVTQVGTVDVLMGGPPCQGNSDLNNHTRRDDPRNQLYGRMARAAEVLRPRIVIVENVPAVIHDREGIVQTTASHLRSLGYTVAESTVSLVDVGVPQKRRRHILVAANGLAFDVGSLFATLPYAGVRPRSVRWAIGDLLGQHGDENAFDLSSTPTEPNRKRIEWLFAHGAYELPNKLRPACHRDKFHTYKSVYGRMHWARPAQTITTGFGSMGQGCYVHPLRKRTITPHEAARLQTFPDFFRFGAVTKRGTWASLIGNAVPPFLTLHLGSVLLPHLTASMSKTGTTRSPRPDPVQLTLDSRALASVGAA